MRWKWLLVPLLITLCSLLGARTSAPPAAVSVAVVDLMKVLSDARPFVAEEQVIRAWIEGEKKNLAGLSAEIEKQQSELAGLASDSPERVRRSRDLDELKLRFRHQVDDRERERARRIMEGQKRWFAETRRAVAQVANARGIHIVLQLRDGLPPDSRPEELNSEIFLTDVLYCDATLDITPEVLKILNR